MQTPDYESTAYAARVRCAHTLVANAQGTKLTPTWFALMYGLLAQKVIPTRALHPTHSSYTARTDVCGIMFANAMRGLDGDDSAFEGQLDWLFLAIENS
jgi:hypothetical protein